MDFDPYETWLGIPADRRPPTYYDLLGLVLYESDPNVIEQAALRRMGKIRLHQVGPHGDRSQDLLGELARARLILMDPDRRAHYDAKLRAIGEGGQVPSPGPGKVGNGDADRRRSRPDDGLPDILGSLVISDEKTDRSSTLEHDSIKPSSPWKNRLFIGAIVASHALLLWGFYYLVFSLSNPKPKGPDPVQNRPNPSPSVAKSTGRLRPLISGSNPRRKKCPTIVAQVTVTPRGAAFPDPEIAGRPTGGVSNRRRRLTRPTDEIKHSPSRPILPVEERRQQRPQPPAGGTDPKTLTAPRVA